MCRSLRLLNAVIRYLLLIVSLITLLNFFPEFAAASITVTLSLLIDQYAVGTCFRPIAWAVIGGVIAYLSAVLASHLSQFAHGHPNPVQREILVIALILLRSAANFTPLIIMLRFFRIGRRPMALITGVMFVSGSFAYLTSPAIGWSRSGPHEFVVTSLGCSIGVVIATIVVCCHEYLKQSHVEPTGSKF